MTPEQFIAQLNRVCDVDSRDSMPLYKIVRNGIKQLVDDKILQAEDVIPSERDISTGLKLSRVTIRKAIQELVKQGLLTQRQGSGTFVTHRVEQALTKLSGFTEDMQARKQSPGVVWFERSIREPTAIEADALALTDNETVSVLYRLRTSNNQPMALELAVLPTRLLKDPLSVEYSLYEVMEQDNNRPVRATQRLHAQICDAQRAMLLGIPKGAAVLHIERRSYLADGTPAEYTQSYYRGDTYDFMVELTL